jgi:hypothetical protein
MLAASAGGRFVPPLTIARSGLGLSAGQYRITDANYLSYSHILGGSATRSGNTISLAPTNSSGTVTVAPPKGALTGATVNVARTPYTFHANYNTTPYCASHWSSGQCAAWGAHHTFAGNIKNGTPANYSDSEGEWWRIW